MHKVYNPTTSIGITINESQFKRLKFSFSNLFGFVHRSIIEKLLSIPECVGIRFYAIERNGIHYVVASAVNPFGLEIKDHYYGSHETINPTGIVPVGPELDLNRAHNRAEMT